MEKKLLFRFLSNKILFLLLSKIKSEKSGTYNNIQGTIQERPTQIYSSNVKLQSNKKQVNLSS